MVMDYPYIRKQAYTAPIVADGLPDGHVFGDELRLAWREPIISDHRTSVAISLYWEILRPTDQIYSATIQLIDNQQNRITGIDVVLGAAMPPFITTSRWQVGKIIKETYILDLPQNAPPIADLMVNVFRDTDWQNSLTYTLPNGVPTGDQFLRLQSFGRITKGVYPQAVATAPQWVFGTDVTLSDATLPTSLTSGEPLILRGVMTAQRVPTYDYIFFVHVVDDAGELVAQADSLYLWNQWTTSALIPNRPIAYEQRVALPALPSGIYEVRFGAYILPQNVRVLLADSTGNRLPNDVGVLGYITIAD